MAFVEWEIKGSQVTNCNCNLGCPCQFNALPSHGNCCAYSFMQIDEGHFGTVRLDGVRWGRLYAWPGAVHQGGGTAMTILDEQSSAEQRAAVDIIARGEQTDPGTLITQVFSTTLSSVQPTQVKRIDLTINPRKRTARVQVVDLLDGSVESIRNPVTGVPHRVSVNLPHGFEYRKAEFLSGKARTAPGPIQLDFDDTHAHIAKVHWSTHGVLG